MDQVNVVTGDVAEAGRELGRVSAELGRGVAAAAGAVEATSATWQGDAAAAFADGWDRVHSGAQTVVEALADAARRLEHAAISYEQQDDSSASTLLALS